LLTDYAEGSLSADGRYALISLWSRLGASTVQIIDLTDNSTVARFEDNVDDEIAQSSIWLADNRLVGLRQGRIFLFDPRTRRTTTPDLGLNSVEQIRVRNVPS
jgi:hypothetical protein